MGIVVLLVLALCVVALAACAVRLILLYRRLSRDYDAFEEKAQGRMDKMRRRTR